MPISIQAQIHLFYRFLTIFQLHKTFFVYFFFVRFSVNQRKSFSFCLFFFYFKNCFSFSLPSSRFTFFLLKMVSLISFYFYLSIYYFVMKMLKMCLSRVIFINLYLVMNSLYFYRVLYRQWPPFDFVDAINIVLLLCYLFSF